MQACRPRYHLSWTIKSILVDENVVSRWWIFSSTNSPMRYSPSERDTVGVTQNAYYRAASTQTGAWAGWMSPNQSMRNRAQRALLGCVLHLYIFWSMHRCKLQRKVVTGIWRNHVKAMQIFLKLMLLIIWAVAWENKLISELNVVHSHLICCLTTIFYLDTLINKCWVNFGMFTCPHSIDGKPIMSQDG